MAKYCEKCGAEISENAIFCSHCGQKIVLNPSQKLDDGRNLPTEENQSHSGCGGVILAILIFAIAMIIFIAAVFVRNNPNKSSSDDKKPNNSNTTDNDYHYTPSLTTRTARTSDFIVDLDIDFSSLSVEITITPNEDIDDLALDIEFYDENDNLLYFTKKNIGNVKEGIQVTKKISLSELGWDCLNIDYYIIKVANGSVSYFQ
jgi:hypothetical protein